MAASLAIGILVLLRCAHPAASASDHFDALVIGGTGFMGRHTVQALLSAGGSVEMVTDGRSSSPWGARVPETVCDRHDACLGLKLRERRWDLVVDFPIFDEGDASPIIQSAQWIGHYIFPSSDDVYMVCNRSLLARGPSGGVLEDSATRPSDAAARSKLDRWDSYGDGKKRLEEVFATSLLNFTALRLPDVWGPFESTGRFVTFLRSLERGRSIGLRIDTGNPVFPVPSYGTSFRPGFVFAKDVAQVVVLLLRAGPQRRPVNVAISESPTFRETVVEAYRAVKRVSPRWPVGDLRFEVEKEVPLLSTDVGPLDIGRAQALGFAPTPWRQGWTETVEALFNASRNDSEAAAELAKCIRHCKPTCFCEPTEKDVLYA